jgi:hypothetical protein
MHLISRYPRGIVGKMLVFHLNVKGSIPTPTMIFLHGFYHEETALLSPLRGTESERERGLIYKCIFSTYKYRKIIFENRVKSIKTSLLENKNKIS